MHSGNGGSPPRAVTGRDNPDGTTFPALSECRKCRGLRRSCFLQVTADWGQRYSWWKFCHNLSPEFACYSSPGGFVCSAYKESRRMLNIPFRLCVVPPTGQGVGREAAIQSSFPEASHAGIDPGSCIRDGTSQRNVRPLRIVVARCDLEMASISVAVAQHRHVDHRLASAQDRLFPGQPRQNRRRFMPSRYGRVIL